MRVISFIEDQDIINKILKHLGLWELNPPCFRRVKPRPPPRMAKAQHLLAEPHIDNSDSKILPPITAFMKTRNTQRTSSSEPEIEMRHRG